MNPKDIEGYAKLKAELETIRVRLNELSSAGFEDMEGADFADFRIS